ncbi:HPr family phosphocarrier protein [Methyloceanibacter caenitepidi]|uniref:Phosphocarrier protein, nitrogen regulation associated n=1 Tax=Methyloceanibacter caenitepidi TaxID=1384459 RepID=A0A0A8K219_9HYPH|nr:HPr family phosphocarrier protein [Methyloceanibacter caenitepidi]BAQ16044.1 phosphocarrier protein, nitrogen regulation associated [Methyloceanibacter caenitepidi]
MGGKRARIELSDPASGTYAANVLIPNKKGLHARASAQFVRTAGDYKANIQVSRDGQTVGGTSIMGLMMLAAGQGDFIHIEASGESAKAAIHALVALVEDGFGEED